jgi:hypothetical protein
VYAICTPISTSSNAEYKAVRKKHSHGLAILRGRSDCNALARPTARSLVVFVVFLRVLTARAQHLLQQLVAHAACRRGSEEKKEQ